MKKSLKMFYTSFTLSSFAIWVANEMFLSVSPISNQDIELPKQNIALFFQKQDNIPQSLAVKKIAHSGLPSLHQPVIEDENLEIADVEDLNVNDSPAIMISSVEDAADIPLEYVALREVSHETNRNRSEKTAKQAEVSSETVIKTATAVSAEVVKTEENYQATDTGVDLSNESAKEPIVVAQLEASPDTPETVADVDESNIIPIENGQVNVAEGRVEIVNEAPQSQTAMVDKSINVSTLAIEADSVEDVPQPREWHSMSESEEDSPWVVAKANQYAKNNKATEELATELDESEINNLLYPENDEDSANVVQTAEMVKNILIPIPEDILNDENLTPQLVSPKKSFSEVEDADKDDEKEESTEVKKKNKKSIFTSLTSLFGGSSDDEESNDDEDSEEDEGNGKKSGFLSSLGKGKNKTVTKILPAEMRLSFQPGRAEISGQTLRWIQAFANKAAEDPDTILEVRIDKNSSYALQQRRLELLHTILDARGIGEDKINTVFTSREPNSFIIRTLRISENSSDRSYKNRSKNSASYQTW